MYLRYALLYQIFPHRWLLSIWFAKLFPCQNFLRTVLKTWAFLSERKPKSSLEASMLADDYLQARKAYPMAHKTPLKEVAY